MVIEEELLAVEVLQGVMIMGEEYVIVLVKSDVHGRLDFDVGVGVNTVECEEVDVSLNVDSSLDVGVREVAIERLNGKENVFVD